MITKADMEQKSQVFLPNLYIPEPVTDSLAYQRQPTQTGNTATKFITVTY